MNDDVVRYAQVDDGSHVAYRISGSGPIDVLEIGSFGTVFPFDASEGQPRWRRFEERLGRFCRLIKFDHRGIGYSDKITAGPTLESWVADAYAVLEAVGRGGVALLATGQGTLGAIEFADRHPHRVSSLILVNGAVMPGSSGRRTTRSALRWTSWSCWLQSQNPTRPTMTAATLR